MAITNTPAITIILCILLVVLAAVGNCGSSITVLSFASNTPVLTNKYKGNEVILGWNELTTQLGMREKLSPIEFSRAYALVDISVYDTLLAIGGNKSDMNIIFYKDNNNGSTLYTSAIAEAASSVMLYLFPDYTAEITKLRSEQVGQFQGDNDMTTKGRIIGNQVSRAVINHADIDNSNLILKDDDNNKTILARENNNCIWTGNNPVDPLAGYWRTYILKSGSEIQPEKPAICGSKADLLDLIETYKIWKHRTPEQINAAHYWGNKPPPVIWNNILSQQIQKHSNMGIFDVAHLSVYLNVGMYDAFVSCWYTKYNYLTARPIERISNITTEIPTPSFPGYTSGHSVISMVASRILGEVFDSDRDYFHNLAIEAGLSRIWAGIHFKQDVVNGINQGNKIADKIIEYMNSKPRSAFIFS
ncbi:MAG TPA: vanadium-dependent haloperoxidase [Nitrososphaeraceae archaeon]|nr:vanadium-dependent haloperoxidase [Nitrososphaeraceae archaeon]